MRACNRQLLVINDIHTSPEVLKRGYIAILLTVLLVLASLPGFTMAQPSENSPYWDLFSEESSPLKGKLPEKALKNHARKVKLNPSVFNQSELHIKLFNGETVVAERQRTVIGKRKTMSWIGEVIGYPGSVVALTKHKGAVTGTISFGSESYEITQTRDGVTILFKVDTHNHPFECEEVHAEEDEAAQDHTTNDGSNAALPAVAADGGAVVDLMVVYTPASRDRYGQAVLEGMIINAVDAVNQAYINSNIDMQLSLVHLSEITYTETGSMSESLNALRKDSDGLMDEVHVWRDLYNADLVSLISEDTTACGLGYVITKDYLGIDAFGFNVIKSSCLDSVSLGHEIGHNLGSAHNRENSSSAGAYPYSYGYRRCMTDGTGFRTIMAYPCSGGDRVHYFSNPYVSYNGFATGIDHEVDPENSADNAQSINNRAPIVATFRNSTQTQSPPAAPSNLVASAPSETKIELSWNDNASDEDGFFLERSTDQASWTVIASLPNNAQAYTDSGLTENTTRYYRVRAYNGMGNSPYSNIASATTTDSAPAAPSSLIASPSTDKIMLDWSSNTEADLEGYDVFRSPTSGGTYIQLNGTRVASSSYSDSSVAEDTVYYYVVNAVDENGNKSGYSNEASAMIKSSADTTPPGTPNDLAASIKRRTRVLLDWSAVSDGSGSGVKHYRIMRNGTQLTTTSGTSYTDSNTSSGTSYTYYLIAVDNADNKSAPGNSVTISTGGGKGNGKKN